MIAVAFVVLAAIFATMRWTRLGLIARGTMQNANMAAALGVNPPCRGLSTRPTCSTFSTSRLSRATSFWTAGLCTSSGPPPGAGQGAQAGVGVVAERIAEGARGHLALGGAVGESRRLQVVLDVVAEGDRQQGEGADQGQDELRPGPGEVGDPIHGAGLYQNSK